MKREGKIRVKYYLLIIRQRNGILICDIDKTSQEMSHGNKATGDKQAF
jgi:hypothetical protein